RRDIELGQHAADHVEADEDLAVLFQERRDGRDDLAITRVDRRLHGLATDVQVAARLGHRGYAQYRTDGLALDEQDALVAVDRLGQILLRERPLGARARRGLEDR